MCSTEGTHKLWKKKGQREEVVSFVSQLKLSQANQDAPFWITTALVHQAQNLYNAGGLYGKSHRACLPWISP